MAQSPPYQLYYNPFSICSLMVLYTLRVKGKPKSPADAVDPEERFIDIYTGEQMTEEYLEKHPKGTVPALLAPSLGVKLTDSTDITQYLCDRYPSLVPPAHKQTIESLLEELHEISYVTISFKPEDRRVEGVMEAVQEIMARPDTSPRYREMLQRKFDNHKNNLQKFQDNNQSIASVEADSRAYLEKISQLLSKHGQQTWIFGAEVGPTALDAHTVVFIARLLDAERAHLIPEDVLRYGNPKLQSAEWLGITKGNPTLHTLWEKQQQQQNGDH
ncbi:uncharacterized protein Z520_08181 [Fonsecaea multimorphosa CBS 102226]|uniref:GST N-terminal domain-containing protein n=1 Tax=Fonsecaea multimorphosa CBS 102226 TaxID=1442371 RepID=A0A0D2IFU2_9EURO|nr:uncharacterized protein Z520_08181 [Fonsecaea multimorphosa CBS 102226]KIX95926.1 hypothetical protein Z520_08181 [Fonsecaea multimorphosa CBS 102226]OAL21697.1 hypothetical protein AYO22_07639 [Fonsecaea multimorphosa]